MATAGLFVLMWGEFMAAALVLIYAGAILVTYVFVIMLAAEAHPEGTGQAMHEKLVEYDVISREPVAASAVGFALLGMLLFVVFDKAPGTDLHEPGAQAWAAHVTKEDLRFAVAADVNPGVRPSSGFVPVGSTQKLGVYLFNRQLVNLELAGLILTVAMVGAIVIARRRVYLSAAAAGAGGGGTGQMLVAPMTPIDDNPHSIPVYGTENPKQKEYPET